MTRRINWAQPGACWKALLSVSVILSSSYVMAQKPGWIREGWLLFAGVKFELKYFKAQDESYLVPVFTRPITERVGTEVSLSGYYMPLSTDDHSLILSRYPYSACFFCGGAGPETVVEVVFADKKPKLKVDAVISVRGKLRLNDSDVDHMNFILYDAVQLQ